MRVQNRTQAAIWALNHGWVATPNIEPARLSLDVSKPPAGQADISEIMRIGSRVTPTIVRRHWNRVATRSSNYRHPGAKHDALLLLLR
jgi:hypothetical protein